MTDNDFLEQQRRAIERMNEMYEKQQIKSGGYKMPPVPSFVKVTNVEEQKNKETAPLKNNFTEEKNIYKKTKIIYPTWKFHYA